MVIIHSVASGLTPIDQSTSRITAEQVVIIQTSYAHSVIIAVFKFHIPNNQTVICIYGTSKFAARVN